jgi:hypothetical protein
MSPIARRLLLVACVWPIVVHAQLSPEQRQLLDAVATAEAFANDSYFSQRDDEAIVRLGHLIAALENVRAATEPNAPVDQATMYDLLLAHGRLAAVYDRRNEVAARDDNLRRALKYSEGCMPPGLRSLDEVTKLIASVDRNYSKR